MPATGAPGAIKAAVIAPGGRRYCARRAHCACRRPLLRVECPYCALLGPHCARRALIAPGAPLLRWVCPCCARRPRQVYRLRADGPEARDRWLAAITSARPLDGAWPKKFS